MATEYSIEEAISRAYEIWNFNPVYSMGRSQDPYWRGTQIGDPAFDCSSFIGTAWNVPGRPPTPYMVQIYVQNGFSHLAYDYNILQRGDILVWNRPGTDGSYVNGHTAMYLGNNRIIECSYNANGISDDRDPGILSWQDILRSGDAGIKIVNVTDFIY